MNASLCVHIELIYVTCLYTCVYIVCPLYCFMMFDILDIDACVQEVEIDEDLVRFLGSGSQPRTKKNKIRSCYCTAVLSVLSLWAF